MAGVRRDVKYDNILSLVLGTPHGRPPEFWQGILQNTIDIVKEFKVSQLWLVTLKANPVRVKTVPQNIGYICAQVSPSGNTIEGSQLVIATTGSSDEDGPMLDDIATMISRQLGTNMVVIKEYTADSTTKGGFSSPGRTKSKL